MYFTLQMFLSASVPSQAFLCAASGGGSLAANLPLALGMFPVLASASPHVLQPSISGFEADLWKQRIFVMFRKIVFFYLYRKSPNIKTGDEKACINMTKCIHCLSNGPSS